MRRVTKFLLGAFVLVCIAGCRTEYHQNQNHEWILVGGSDSASSSSGSGSSRFLVEAFSSAPVSTARRSFLSKHSDRDDDKASCSSSSSRLFGKPNNDADDAAKALQEKAAALRREVEAFEASKQEETDQLQKEVDDRQREKDGLRRRYQAVVPILKGDGTVAMERCDFPPRMTGGASDADGDADGARPQLSRIVAFQAPLPLGIVLGQDEELPLAQRPTTVDAVAEGGNADRAGVRVGDCLRACTACQMTMEQPTWQLIAGGIGRPKTTRMMFGTDNQSFEQVMDAIASNAMDPEAQDVWLVVERMDEDDDDDDENKDDDEN